MLDDKMKKGYGHTYDQNPEETCEWLDSYKQVLQHWGPDQGQMLISRMQLLLQNYRFEHLQTDLMPVWHQNTMVPSDVPDNIMDPSRRSYRLCITWNAVAMVVRAQRSSPGIGGHIASGLSVADAYHIGYEYFFQGSTDSRMADCVFFQGHSSPVTYARSYIEGRFDEADLDHFRREVSGRGLSSYPHPYLMPDYWQFPTVSMGLGLLQAIHTARVLKYLHHRKLCELSDRRVWSFVGDAEMREPESMSALLTASVDRLSHLTVILNANLQGLDGLCHGNGSVIREYASLFAGFGWRVIKVVWNKAWLDLFASEKTGVFESWAMSWLDGDHQNFYYHGPSYIEKRLESEHPELMDWLHEHRSALSDLLPGGHDEALLYQAYAEAKSYTSGPSVIIIQTIKGRGLPMASQNIAHQNKSLSGDDLIQWAKYCQIPLSESEASEGTYYRSDEMKGKFLEANRCLPERSESKEVIELPSEEEWIGIRSGKGVMSTTTSFVRVLGFLLRCKNLAPRIVPIVADEARTFGMEGLFKQLGVYKATGSHFEAHDLSSLTGYREGEAGQLLQEGVNEAGALASWIACATSYSVNHVPLVPFYIFYSMFGFQRVMDLIWAAADSRARGFLLGATAGKTTLEGEGLQHADGHSLLLASVVPSVVSFDPAWHGEVASIVQHGLTRMLEHHEDLIVYITVVNEGVAQKALPEAAHEGSIRGLYLFEKHIGSVDAIRPVALLGSGAIFHEAYMVFECLKSWGISASIYSATSYSELQRDAMLCDDAGTASYVRGLLSEEQQVIVSVSDYVRALGDMIRPWVRGDYSVLGTDGFGLSDNRSHLRKHFKVDSSSIMKQVLTRLLVLGDMDSSEFDKRMTAWEVYRSEIV